MAKHTQMVKMSVYWAFEHARNFGMKNTG